MFFNDYYNSPIGNITMASDGESLCGLWFDEVDVFVFCDLLFAARGKRFVEHPIFRS